MQSVSQSDSSKQATTKMETQDATLIVEENTVVSNKVNQTIGDSNDLTVDNSARQDVKGKGLKDNHLNDGSNSLSDFVISTCAADDDSTVETGERVNYCVIETSEGELKEKETPPLSTKN